MLPPQTHAQRISETFLVQEHAKRKFLELFKVHIVSTFGLCVAFFSSNDKQRQ